MPGIEQSLTVIRYMKTLILLSLGLLLLIANACNPPSNSNGNPAPTQPTPSATKAQVHFWANGDEKLYVEPNAVLWWSDSIRSPFSRHSVIFNCLNIQGGFLEFRIRTGLLEAGKTYTIPSNWYALGQSADVIDSLQAKVTYYPTNAGLPNYYSGSTTQNNSQAGLNSPMAGSITIDQISADGKASGRFNVIVSKYYGYATDPDTVVISNGTFTNLRYTNNVTVAGGSRP